jgi:hypothetical protein
VSKRHEERARLLFHGLLAIWEFEQIEIGAYGCTAQQGQTRRSKRRVQSRKRTENIPRGSIRPVHLATLHTHRYAFNHIESLRPECYAGRVTSHPCVAVYCAGVFRTPVNRSVESVWNRHRRYARVELLTCAGSRPFEHAAAPQAIGLVRREEGERPALRTRLAIGASAAGDRKRDTHKVSLCAKGTNAGQYKSFRNRKISIPV